MELNCPYCDAATNTNFESTTDRPADDFDAHYIGVACSECNNYYEISYSPVNILYWTDDDEMRMA